MSYDRIFALGWIFQRAVEIVLNQRGNYPKSREAEIDREKLPLTSVDPPLENFVVCKKPFSLYVYQQPLFNGAFFHPRGLALKEIEFRPFKSLFYFFFHVQKTFLVPKPPSTTKRNGDQLNRTLSISKTETAKWMMNKDATFESLIYAP